MTQQPQLFQAQISQTVQLNYLLFLPPGYAAEPDVRWPLILFLHGSGGRGDNLDLVKETGLAKNLDTETDFPFIVISPQCSADSWWLFEIEALNRLLDEVIHRYKVDVDRVYLTGLSMGGFGVWGLATAHPERFAAIAPICGRAITLLAAKLKHVPVWAFHGAFDEVVPLIESQKMVNAVRAAGGDARLTIYPEADHDAWSQAYADPELYRWLLSHTRRS